MNIEGLGTGYQGQGVKTILPAEARAKMEVRLVPGLEPKQVLELIRKQLDQNGFEKIELVFTLGEMSYRSDMSAPSILNVIDLAKRFIQKGSVSFRQLQALVPCIRSLRPCKFQWLPLVSEMPIVEIMVGMKM